jgi:hypothetical protein
MAYGSLLADTVQGSTASTPPVFKDGNGTQIGTLCRAWVNFNGTGTVAIRGSFNVSSITDNGTGDYTVNFTTALPDANYSSVANGSYAGSATVRVFTFDDTTRSTTQCRLYNMNGTGTMTDPVIASVSFFR